MPRLPLHLPATLHASLLFYKPLKKKTKQNYNFKSHRWTDILMSEMFNAMFNILMTKYNEVEPIR